MAVTLTGQREVLVIKDTLIDIVSKQQGLLSILSTVRKKKVKRHQREVC